MRILMKCMNEERSVNRCIGDFHDEKWVDEIVVIDGCSNDYTVEELKQFSKVKVYIHPWIDWYHNMECIQSNIGLSYMREGEIFFILDFDERMNKQLKNYLSKVKDIDFELGSVARQTMDCLRYENSPYGMIDKEGWPLVSHQIGQFPDFQPRLIKKSFKFHWVNSPHHLLCGVEKEQNLPESCFIIHYEKDDIRDRERIEKKWLRNKLRREELGLSADVFETKTKPEIAKFTKNYWRKENDRTNLE